MPTYVGSGGTERYSLYDVEPTPPTAAINRTTRWVGVPLGLRHGVCLIQPVALSALENKKAEKVKAEVDNEPESLQIQHGDTDETVAQLHNHRPRSSSSFNFNKRGRSPLPLSEESEEPSPKKHRRRRGRRGKAKEKHAKLDRKYQVATVSVLELRFSQRSCKDAFCCGRSVWGLVQDLLHEKVKISASFLRLTVFETMNEKTNERILRCSNNRRLFALKEYANRSGKDVFVSINLYSQTALTDFKRFMRNSDRTDGRTVRLRTEARRRNKRDM